METPKKNGDSRLLGEITSEIISSYIRERLKDKYQLRWSNVKNSPKAADEYNEKKGKIAREAFLAIRSREAEDFVEYFAATLCSYHQFSLKENNGEGYYLISKALYDEEERNQLRTLTMLALCANGYNSKSDSSGESE